MLFLILLVSARCVANALSLNSAGATLGADLITTSLSPNQRALQAMPQFPRTWVPLASVFEIDGSRPNKVEFMGQSYVCYQSDPDDRNGWTVVDDACPHRLAPLSEGRIITADKDANEIQIKDLKNYKGETKRLVECAYHGWAFDQGGKCVRIPQATEEVQKRTIESNPKCHIQSYSTRVCKNVVFAWLWPEDCLQYTDLDPNNHEHAWRQPEFMLANLGEETTTYTRDVPYGWDTLLENIVDISHIPWVSACVP
jgi:pheophorbide a oxygenase